MPFRNYLMEFVVPVLNEGLLEVSNIIPNDPVDLLAEYLYQKSYDCWKIHFRILWKLLKYKCISFSIDIKKLMLTKIFNL